MYSDISLQKLDLQQRILMDVLLKLLGDEDQRVRHAAATAFCRYSAVLSSGKLRKDRNVMRKSGKGRGKLHKLTLDC